MKYLLVIFSLYCVTNLCQSQQLEGPTIQTNRGLIKGFKQIRFGIEINSYLGIPYASPPIGPRRFQKTLELSDNFTGVFHADRFGPVCYQNKTDAEAVVPGQPMSENCLTLNIWTPNDAPGQTLYPVLISIYGSDFIFGGSSRLNMVMDYFTAHTNIVTVNFNYRLGTLGLAYDGTDQFIGNQAIHDFFVAADWIRSNIRAFGGDPERITISGYSSGAVTLSAIFMSPSVPTNWFKRMIFFSGAAAEHATTWSPSQTLKLTRKVASEVNCSLSSNSKKPFNSDETNCLKSTSANVIANAPSNENYFITYGDKYILPVRPSVLINSRQFPKGFTILVGTEVDEVIRYREFIDQPKNVTAAIDLLTKFLNEIDLTSIADASKIVQKYFVNVTEFDIPTIRKRVHTFLANLQIHCPSLLHSIAYSRDQANTVYSYRYNYLSKSTGTEGRPFGTYHGDGHNLFFGLPFKQPELHSDKDRELSLLMMNLLGDFIKGIDPFWSPVNVTGHRPDQIFLHRWNLKNNGPLTNVDQDQDKEICFEWAKYFKLTV